MKYAVFIFMFVLSGCAGDQRNGQTTVFPQTGMSAPRTTGERANEPVILAEPRLTPPADSSDKIIGAIRTESDASQKATQQSLTGLGANIGQIAEKLVGVEASVQNVVKVQTELKAQVDLAASIKAEFKANVDAVANLKAELAPQIAGLAAGQAGLTNTIKTSQETIHAGGNVTQMPENVSAMVTNIVDKSQEQNSRNIWIMAGVLTTVLGAPHVKHYLDNKKIQKLIADKNVCTTGEAKTNAKPV